MRVEPSWRRDERGFTLFEAIVVIAITALASALLFSMIGRSTTRTWAQSDVSIGISEAANAEAELRAMFASSQLIAGDGLGVTIAPSLARSARCMEAGGQREVRLLIRQRSLECESGGRRRTLLAWRRGDGQLTYSADGRIWLHAWSASGPVIVQFHLTENGRTVLAWALLGGARAPSDGAAPS